VIEALGAEPAVILTISSRIAVITLNRPKKLNSLSPEVVAALDEALDSIEHADDVRVVVITGRGRAFSAGGDLESFRRWLDADAHSAIVDSVFCTSTVLRRLERLRQPVLAAINGVAVAGGLELILCCDLALAAHGATIGDGHVKYCILPGGGGSVRLPRKIDFALAKYLLLTGERLPAESFVACGLIREVVPADKLIERTMNLATQLAGLSPLALSSIKQLANAYVSQDIDDALKNELEAFSSHITSADFREGVQAFTDTREPHYTGT
jgi:enoyl-CoA hydratase